MHRLALPLAALFFVSLSLLAAETKPAEAKPEAKVDKALAKPKAEIARFWVTPEFLMWWSKDGLAHDLYVLRTTDGSDPFLDNPAAQRLFDNNDQDYGMQLGGRLTFGMWADEARKWGFELSGFALQKKSDRWSGAWTGVGESVAFSIYDVASSNEDAWWIAFPGMPGTISISSSSQLWGVEGSGLVNLKRTDNLSLDASFGVRHLNLSEDFIVGSTSLFSVPGLPAEDWWQKDTFEAQNRFFGAKLGLRFNLTAWERLLVNVEPSVALGANDESLRIRGATRVNDLSGPSGFLAMITNIGDYSKAKFAVVPEIKVGLGCKITKNLSFMANYNFLYASNVVRPGSQVSRRHNIGVDPWWSGTGIPFDPTSTPREPAPRFKTTDYWAHGVGVNFKITW